METNRAQITYSGPELFLSSDQWATLRVSILGRMPLRNMHWRSTTRPSIRTVQELRFELVALTSVREQQASQIPSMILDRPLLNIFAVICEDNDAYKNVVRKQIKDWHNIVSQKRNQEWLILLVVRPDSHVGGKRLFQIKSSILDKIKSDFNVDKRDRCVQLMWAPGIDDPAAWTDLISKMKDGIMATFDANVQLREDEVRRSENQRQIPGWNFCTFYMLKESLASSFEGMNLLEDAEVQYNELEASLSQVTKERYSAPFATFGGLAPRDDSAPLLSLSKKPYQDLILSNTISEFDFRIYLLDRQCALLARMGKIVEAVRKASLFVNAFSRSLREHQHILGRFFVESWMYSAALNVVDQCQDWVSRASLESAALSTLNGIKGELLELARNQLDKIGIEIGHLPHLPPFTMSLSTSSAINAKRDDMSSPSSPLPPNITQKDLLSAIADQDTFDKLYIMITNRTIECYTPSGRRRFALKLYGSLAGLDRHRSRLPTALTTFSSLPAHYVGTKWVALEGFMLARGLDTHARLGKPRDREWIGTAMAFLKAFVNVGENYEGQALLRNGVEELNGHRRVSAEYIQSLMDGIKASAEGMDKDLPIADHPILSIRVGSEQMSLAEDVDGCRLKLVVTNHLPCRIKCSAIRAWVTGRNGQERLELIGERHELGPGDSSVSLFSPISTFGMFAVSSVEIQISRLLLNWSFAAASGSTPGSSSSKNIPNQRSTIVKIPRDPIALDSDIDFPRTIQLGLTPQIVCTIKTGRNDITTLHLKLASAHLRFSYADASVYEGSIGSFNHTEDGITLETISTHSVVSIIVPFFGSLEGNPVPITTHVKYFTSKDPNVERVIERERKMSGALPLVVNVQDYFRGKRLFSRFTVSSDGRQYIRIRNATLIGTSDTLDITGCHPRGSTSVTPERPTNFLFKIESLAEGPRIGQESLQIVVKYRTFQDEVEARFRRAIQSFKPPLPEENQYWMVHAFNRGIQGSKSWRVKYGASGKLDLLSTNSDEPNWNWGNILRNMKEESSSGFSPDGDLLQQVDDTMHAIVQGLNDEDLITVIGPDDDDRWRTLILPVDLPYLNILNAAKLEIPSLKQKPMYAGQPVSAQLTISTSFHWGAPDRPTYRLRYDVLADLDGATWLVSGPKRGDFDGKDGSTYSTEITLIPLRHGSVTLPTVSVTAVAVEDDNEWTAPSCETHQVHGAVVINVLPRSARATFAVSLPTPVPYGYSDDGSVVDV